MQHRLSLVGNQVGAYGVQRIHRPAQLFARSGGMMGWALRDQLLARHFFDLAYSSPIAIRHRHAKQFLSACRELGSAHAFGCMQIEYTLTQIKPLTFLSKAVELL